MEQRRRWNHLLRRHSCAQGRMTGLDPSETFDGGSPHDRGWPMADRQFSGCVSAWKWDPSQEGEQAAEIKGQITLTAGSPSAPIGTLPALVFSGILAQPPQAV